MVTKWSPLPIKEGGTDGTTPKSARRALGISEGVSSDNFVSVKDFPFGAVGDGVTDDTAAITAANAAAVAAGKALYWPQTGAKYLYKPTATLNLSVDWYSDNSTFTSQIQVDTALFSGPYFQMVTGCELRNISINQKGSGKVGTGLLIEASNPANFVGAARLSGSAVIGFAKNVDVGQTLLLHFEDVTLTGGTEGFHCAPTGAGGITTHIHINGYYASNTRNVRYAPTNGGQRVVFVGGAIELATGAAEQAAFSNLSGLRFLEMYCEGASTIPALRLICTADVDGLFLNGTGGVTLGTNADVSFSRVQAVTATDLLLGADGTQTVFMERCGWRSSGNSASTSFAKFTSIHSNYNGLGDPITFQDPVTALDSGAAVTARGLNNGLRGTLTPVIVGSTGAGAGTYTAQLGFWERVGNVVDFWLRVTWTAHTGTGNLQISGMPYLSDSGIADQILGPIMADNLTWVAGSLLAADLPANSKKMDLYSFANAGALTAVPIDAAATIWMSGRYRAAS